MVLGEFANVCRGNALGRFAVADVVHIDFFSFDSRDSGVVVAEFVNGEGDDIGQAGKTRICGSPERIDSQRQPPDGEVSEGRAARAAGSRERTAVPCPCGSGCNRLPCLRASAGPKLEVPVHAEMPLADAGRRIALLPRTGQDAEEGLAFHGTIDWPWRRNQAAGAGRGRLAGGPRRALQLATAGHPDGGRRD